MEEPLPAWIASTDEVKRCMVNNQRCGRPSPSVTAPLYFLSREIPTPFHWESVIAAYNCKTGAEKHLDILIIYTKTPRSAYVPIYINQMQLVAFLFCTIEKCHRGCTYFTGVKLRLALDRGRWKYRCNGFRSYMIHNYFLPVWTESHQAFSVAVQPGCRTNFLYCKRRELQLVVQEEVQPGCATGSAARLYKRKCSHAVQEVVQPGCSTIYPSGIEKGTTLQPGCTRGSAARRYKRKCSQAVELACYYHGR